MASEIKLPKLVEGFKGGDVVDVKVTVGAEVTQNQPLIEVEVEKSTVEVKAPSAGRITKVLIKKGEHVKIGQLLFEFEGSANGTAAPAATPTAPAAAPPSKSQPAASPQPPKAAKPPEKPAEKPAAAPAPASAPPEQVTEGEEVVPAGPATRRVARELGVDLQRVKGTGPRGRVTQEDVHAYVRQLTTQAATGGGGAVAAPPLPQFEKWGGVERQPLTGLRRTIGERLTLAWNLIPHVTQHDLADITELEAFRKQQDTKGAKAEDGRVTRLTVTAFALKAAAIALKQFPHFNASLDLAGNQVIYKQYYHLGVAVDTDRGLVVPVLSDVDKKSVHDLAKELGEVAQKARDKKLTGDDMSGGTFTITNLGGIGGTAFTPIINYPEVAILGMSRSKLQPVERGGQVALRLMLPLSLSYDHRIIDGADAARFTRRVVEMLENPLVMLLHA